MHRFGWTSSLTGLPYGKKLAKHRQMHQSYLSRQNCSDYMPMQVEEARALVYNLLNSEPARYETCLSRSANYNSSSRLRIHSSFSIRFATGLITQIVAGHKIESDDDPYLRIAKAGLESMSRAGGAPGGSAVDFFPFREWIHLTLPLLLSLASRLEVQYFPRWFPGTHYVAVADRWRPTVRELYEHSVRSVRDKRVSSRPNPYLGSMGLGHSANDVIAGIRRRGPIVHPQSIGRNGDVELGDRRR